ncbi:MAG: undecaprenyl-diphosphate phosphatase [Oceanospirillaceae bacterium]|nr:undecaprenyl-diphosphate phosphatase [Oceanospirillaceae bacterium]MCP5349762.1 undecaprenyl-diphosphate phosphatase [Oceanospirillaceae bacterium]
MEIWQAIVLSLLQGFTEFLPISSSAHLILPSQVLGWPDQGLAFDVAVHVGTLMAVLLYFRRDVAGMAQGFYLSTVKRQMNEQGRLAWWVIIGTIPAGLAGMLFNDFIEANLRSVLVIGVTTIVFGLLLGWADKNKHLDKGLSALNLKSVLIIACAQAVALIPGTSRSGITMTAALFLGFQRDVAAKFSFYLSMPLIFCAGALKIKELIEAGVQTHWSIIALGVAVSAISAYVCIHFFLAFISRMSMQPFVIYRLLLGVALIGGVYAGWFA